MFDVLGFCPVPSAQLWAEAVPPCLPACRPAGVSVLYSHCFALSCFKETTRATDSQIPGHLCKDRCKRTSVRSSLGATGRSSDGRQCRRAGLAWSLLTAPFPGQGVGWWWGSCVHGQVSSKQERLQVQLSCLVCPPRSGAWPGGREGGCWRAEPVTSFVLLHAPLL